MAIRRYLVALLALFLPLTLAGCGSSEGGSSGGGESGPIKIGAVLGISGRFAFVGKPQEQALKLAEEKINADGGIDGRKVQFVIYDDEVDETKTVPLVNRLISEDKVVAIIGPSITVPALAIQSVVDRAKIPNMTLTSKAIWEGSKDSYIFQTTPREEVEVKSILSFLANKVGAKSVGVIYDRQPYGTGNLAIIEKFAGDFGLKIVAKEGIESADTNADAQVARIKAAKPDAVILWVGDPGASSVAKAMQQAGLHIPMIGSSAIAGPTFAKLGGKAAEGVYSDSTYNTSNPPANQKEFLTQFAAKYGAPPTQFAGFAYDAAFALKGAIEKAGGKTDGESIRQGLLDMAPYKGVVATFDFTADNHNGIANGPLFYIIQVKDGAYKVVYDTRQQ